MTEGHLIKQAIAEVHYRYCRSMDRMDRELYDTVFVPGASMDYGDFTGTSEGFGDWVWEAHSGMQGHSHQIANILVEVGRDENTAVSEAYVTVCLRTKADEGGRFMDIVDRGRYLDRWSLTDDGTWRITERVYRSDVRQLLNAPLSGAATAVRDRTDPSYLFFA